MIFGKTWMQYKEKCKSGFGIQKHYGHIKTVWEK